jgi:hypothetical protein
MTRRARRSGGWAIALVPLLASANASAGPGGFTFTPPPGWVDVSRGAPEAQRRKAPPALRAQADNPIITFLAMDPEHWDDGFIENMNVVVQTGKNALPSTPEVLAEVAKAAAAEAAKAGLTYRTTKVEVTKVAGVNVGRLTADLTGPGVAAKQVQYMIPGDRSEAMLTYTAAPDSFARYAPLFEASAQATLGAVEPPTRSMVDSARLGGIAGAIGGALGALLVVRSKRRRQLQRRQQQAPPAPGSGPG